MRTAYVEVEVDLDSFDDDDIIQEMDARGLQQRWYDDRVYYWLRDQGSAVPQYVRDYVYNTMGRLL